ncbi:MAG: FISUMP domain-containing protein [Bacteroidales bacterium]
MKYLTKILKVIFALLLMAVIVTCTKKEEEDIPEENPTPTGVPEVSTASVSLITLSSAQCGGEVINEGDSAVTDRGVCWNTATNPTIANNYTNDGSGLGGFLSSLTNLEPATTYYVKAYATNAIGTAYGEELSFSTPIPGAPEISTSAATYVTENSAKSGGNVIDEGDSEVTARGICWGLQKNPTLADSVTIDGSGIGQFVSSMSGLTPATKYYVRAYATNSVGTSYGNEIFFSTISQPELPEVETYEITAIAQTSAQGGGYISSQGSTPIIARGVCWSSEPDPSFDDSHTLDGHTIGEFLSELTNLTPNTLYYVKAYARNQNGFGYGQEVTFTTMEDGDPPTVVTEEVINISWNSATAGGNITDQGTSSVTEKGVCWSTEQDPDLNDNFTTEGPGSGSFTSQIGMLLSETTYYVRAYASNNSGFSYGNEVSFTTDVEGILGEPCPGLPSVTYEGQEYNTVYIGGQCWLKENLNVGLKILDSEDMSDNGVIEKYCYDDSDANCDTYGGLYKWEELMNYTTDPETQGICPDGWHIPTQNEYNYMIGYLGSEFVAGGKMKSTGTLESGTGLWLAPNTGATNESGFTGHPGGQRLAEGTFYDLSEQANFWTSTEFSQSKAYSINIQSNWDDVNVNNDYKGPAFSVRCIKD